MPRADSLSSTFAALADPTRRAMLARLALGEMSVNELAKPFKMSGPAVCKHLKVLERAGLITRGRAAQRRPCRLAPAGLKESGQAKSGQAKSGQAKPRQAKPGKAAAPRFPKPPHSTKG